jgi:hypothetical protein
MALIVNLMLAAWIKFNGGYKTALVTTIALAIGMLAIAKTFVKWAQHLFTTGMPSDHRTLSVSESGADLQDVAGLPFDWHRLPCSTCVEPHAMPCARCIRAHEALQVCVEPLSTHVPKQCLVVLIQCTMREPVVLLIRCHMLAHVVHAPPRPALQI